MPRGSLSSILWSINCKNIPSYSPPGMGLFKIPPIKWWALFNKP